MGRGDVLRFTVEYFCDTVPKFSFGEPFGVSENFGCRTNSCKGARGVGFHEFPLNNFCLRVPKSFVGEPFGVFDFFETRKNLYIRGGYHNSLSKFFYFTVPKNFCWSHSVLQKKPSKNSQGNPFWFQRVSGLKTLHTHEKRSDIKIFARNSNYNICRMRLGYKPRPTTAEPCCLTHCALGTIGLTGKCH